MQDLKGKVVFVAGASTGLGRAIAKGLVKRGAHVTLFARRQAVLEEAKAELFQVAVTPSQEIRPVPVDLANARQVEEVFAAQPKLPDALYCVAGGVASEIGLFSDISAETIEGCMRKNYLTSAFPAHTLVKLWKQDDERAAVDSKNGLLSIKPRTRQLVFINSAAALAGIPGYDAYTPAKCAQRALADTLRQEVLMYSTPTSRYTVHCAFPGSFLSDSFIEEQRGKPELTKHIEKTTGSLEDVTGRIPTADVIAERILIGVGKGDFAICSDWETEVLWTNMIGPSPKRGWGVVDTLLGLLSGLVIWPFLRRDWDAMSAKFGKEGVKSKKVPVV